MGRGVEERQYKGEGGEERREGEKKGLEEKQDIPKLDRPFATGAESRTLIFFDAFSEYKISCEKVCVMLAGDRM